MKKGLIGSVGLAALIACAAPLYAAQADGSAFPSCMPTPSGNGAATCTARAADVALAFPVGPSAGLPCSPDGLLVLSLSGFFHITVNKAGDAWVTSTLQGPAQLVPTDPTLPTYAGHAETWFGQSSNNQNSVQHDTFNVHVAAGGASVGFHMVDHMSTNADGTVTVSFSKPTCS